MGYYERYKYDTVKETELIVSDDLYKNGIFDDNDKD